MWYALVFTILGIALVAIVLTRSARPKPKIDPAPHHHSGSHPGTEHASYTDHGSVERKERKRRRAQSAHDRRKRH